MDKSKVIVVNEKEHHLKIKWEHIEYLGSIITNAKQM